MFPYEFQVCKLWQWEEYLFGEHIQVFDCDFGWSDVDAANYDDLHLIGHFGE